MIRKSIQMLLFDYFRKSVLDSTYLSAGYQEKLLYRIISKNAETTFGKEHLFSSIKSIQDYQVQVPILEYSHYASYIDRIQAGEKMVLTAEPVHYFVLTSGSTTGKQKLIPITSSSQKGWWIVLLASQGIIRRYNYSRQINQGVGVMLVSPSMGKTIRNVEFGPVSAALARKAKLFWSNFSLIPYEVNNILDSDSRRYLILRFMIEHENISFINAPFIPTLLIFSEVLRRNIESLIRDLSDGSINRDLQLSTIERRLFSRYLRVDKEKASKLAKFIDKIDEIRPRDIWPRLGWLYTALGPTFRNYEERVKELYEPDNIWGVPYIASEGVMGFPLLPNSYSHIPAITSTFLEFIPENDWSVDNPQTLLVQDLEINQRYEIVISNTNGLYRYRVGDIIQIDGSIGALPTFRIISRTKEFLSVSWEKSSDAQVVWAVQKSLEQLAISANDYVFDIDHSITPSRYRLWIEFSSQYTNVRQDLIQQLDKYLCLANPIYNILRTAGEISPPIVAELPKNTFERLRYDREQHGLPSEQLKILHILTSKNQLDALLNQTM